VQLTHVPYRNIAQYTPDFLAGQVPLGFQLLPNVLGLLKSGDALALAVTSDKRMTALPDVPTAAEAGVKNYTSYAWLAMLAPAGTPRAIVDKNYTAMAEALKNPQVIARFTQQGAEPVAPGPDDLAKFIKSETVKWGEIIHKAGIKPMRQWRRAAAILKLQKEMARQSE
jgi:tripartite-type tricarboxylate transporter receptor subunit TctC